MESTRIHRGFTLVELLVVLAIIVAIMAIVFTNQSSFNKTLTLTNTAYDVALSIRSAETYGLSSRATSGNIKNAGYGIHLSSAQTGSFILFSDTSPASSASSACHPKADTSAPDAKPGNCVYDSGELVTTYKLGNGITISNFCAFAGPGNSAGNWKCMIDNSGNGGGGSLNSLDIVFARPNPEPFMSSNGSYSAVQPVTTSCLVLTSPQGGTRYILVTSAGAITANATSCTNSAAIIPGCTPNCSGKVCGDDGCEGSCGSCNGNRTCVAGACVQNVSTPTNLVLSHTTRSKSFAVSWTAGSGNGGADSCKLQFNVSGSTWMDITSAGSVNCDANSSAVSYTLNGDNWKANWNNTQVRIVRKSDSAVMGTFQQTLNCSAIAGSSSATPTIDEDCNGYWDNFAFGGCTVPGKMGTWYYYSNSSCTTLIGSGSYQCQTLDACNAGCQLANASYVSVSCSSDCCLQSAELYY